MKVDLGTFAHTLSAFEITKPSSYLDASQLVDNLPTFVSDGEQRNRGIEWSFFGSPIEHVRLMGGFTYLDPELTKTNGGGNDGHTAVAVPKIRLSLEQSGIPSSTRDFNLIRKYQCSFQAIY